MLGVDHSLQSVIAVFQGTNNTKNWLDDARVLKKDYKVCKGCKIHIGFYEAFSDL